MCVLAQENKIASHDVAFLTEKASILDDERHKGYHADGVVAVPASSPVCFVVTRARTVIFAAAIASAAIAAATAATVVVV
jgi:hypothetical protein